MPYTNKRNLSLPVAVWLANDTYDKDPSYISGSQLAQSDRQIVLGYRVNEQSVDLSSLVAARLGHAINDAIDNAWKSPGLMRRIVSAGFNPLFEYEINPTILKPGKIPVYMQQRFNEEVNGRILSGAPDLIMNGRLTDYKSTSVFAWQKKETGDYLWQLTTYRYLARELISDDTATIQFILKDWSELRASKDPEYPQTPCPVMLVRVGSPAECLARITARIERLKALMLLDQSELPTCSDDELWLDPPKFAYYKDAFADGKGRATRVFDTEAEAIQFMGTKLGAGKIITRKGEPKACNYCEAATICSQRASWNT
jgi:hypothetical protein